MNLDTSKKSQYHSALVANSPLTVRVLSEPRESKYRKQGESGHLYIKLAIDGYEFAYGAENEACAKPFEGKQGQDVTIEATGSRDSARIRLNGSQEAHSSNVDKPSTRPDSPGVSRQHPEQQNDSSDIHGALQQVCNAQYLIKKAVRDQWEQAAVDKVIPQFEILAGNAHYQADCSSAFIKLDRAGEVDKLSTTPIWREKKAQEEDEF